MKTSGVTDVENCRNLLFLLKTLAICNGLQTCESALHYADWQDMCEYVYVRAMSTHEDQHYGRWQEIRHVLGAVVSFVTTQARTLTALSGPIDATAVNAKRNGTKYEGKTFGLRSMVVLKQALWFHGIRKNRSAECRLLSSFPRLAWRTVCQRNADEKKTLELLVYPWVPLHTNLCILHANKVLRRSRGSPHVLGPARSHPISHDSHGERHHHGYIALEACLKVKNIVLDFCLR